MPDQSEDEQLVTDAINGDVQAFSNLVEKYSDALYSVAYGVIGDFHLAQDIVQESFLKAYYQLHTLKDRDKAGSWLYAIAFRRSIDWKRKLQREERQREKQSRNPMETWNHTVSVEERVEQRENQAEIWRALNQLSEVNRIIVTLFHLNGFSMERIGKLLNLSVSAVESRHRRARQVLKQELQAGLFAGLRNPHTVAAMAAKVTDQIVRRAGHFYIPVSDKLRSSAWFREQFGLPADEDGHLLLPSGQRLYLLKGKPAASVGHESPAYPLLAFAVDNLNEAYDRLKSSGVRLDEQVDYDRIVAEKHFFFYDLDGNRFGIMLSP